MHAPVAYLRLCFNGTIHAEIQILGKNIRQRFIHLQTSIIVSHPMQTIKTTTQKDVRNKQQLKKTTTLLINSSRLSPTAIAIARQDTENLHTHIHTHTQHQAPY